MSSERGFTLLEVMAAALIGVVVVLGVGLLGENLSRRRVSADSISAAVGIADHTLEQLVALTDPGTDALLTAGTHGPCASPPCLVGTSGGVDASTVTLNGPYLLEWTVVDNATSETPLVDPDGSSKKVTVTVTHARNTSVRAQLETYIAYD